MVLLFFMKFAASETSASFTSFRKHWWNENGRLINGQKSVRFQCKLYQEPERRKYNPCDQIKIAQSQSINTNGIWSGSQLHIVE